MTTSTNAGAGETSGQNYNVAASGCDVNFQNLFKVFAAAAGTCVADQLANDLVSAYTDAPFIVISGREFLVFENDSVTEIPFRAGVTGFNELTSISHIGPALGYFAELKERGVDVSASMSNFGSVVQAVKDLNDAAPIPDYSSGQSANPNDSYWLNKLTVTGNPLYAEKAASIQKLISQSCDQTLAFMDNYDLSYSNLYSYFFNDVCPKATDGISFNNAMIATFCLVNSDTALSLSRNELLISVDWANCNVMITGQSGGISSGLNTGTNSTYASLHNIVQNLGVDITGKVLFAPYVEPAIDSIVNATYSSDDARKTALLGMANTYKTRYFNMIARSDVAAKMFDPDKYDVLPQVYPTWEDDDVSVDTLMKRLKTVMLDPRQLLSNGTSSACGQLLNDAGWDASKVSIPGMVE